MSRAAAEFGVPPGPLVPLGGADAALAWACERMLEDLAHRHPAARLALVREFLSSRR